MLVFLGITLVFAAVLGGYLLEHGNPWVLLQPAELLIIGGAALGIVLVANPSTIIRKTFRGAWNVWRSPKHSEHSYVRTLRMLYELFTYGQRAGMGNLEADVEDPKSSPIFSNYPEVLQDHVTLQFICDSMRLLVIGATSSHALDHLMDLDIEVQRRGRQEPVLALSSVADSLPGLGIVAAVLGVVITMQSIGGSPATIGEKVAAALVGTFLGILLCYGVVGPIGTRLEHRNEADNQFQQVLRAAIGAYSRGAPPILAIEYGRRSIPVEVRPTFAEMDINIRREAKVPPVASPGVFMRPAS